MKKIIYDIGSNNGDDIPYYLKKADIVVAVEANPALCEQIQKRFAEEIGAGRLFIENCVVTTGNTDTEVLFYIHKERHVLSQFPMPDPKVIREFEEVRLPSRSILAIVRQYGEAYYMKIDIENYDEKILRALFEAGIKPRFISAESYDIDIFSLMLTSGGYRSYNLINAPYVARDFANHPIATLKGKDNHSFPHHSSGPFGDDIPTPWMTPNNFARFLVLEGLGWKDIHATNEIPPEASKVAASLGNYQWRTFKATVRHIIRRIFRV